ncbi:uncharacterized protein FIBRA_08405 [Fibroporia radiculosa]|uniref:Uncharacterized protein n=1 Tax=Fibroporia radiculosa TaxID=599839 RepID=J4GWR3_9APHY|nr:uncharacterized protein FIBRA_08405 [Fibroporia radiculosa]CCM06165.1 predicted protein [Fibroporia radiculosa]
MTAANKGSQRAKRPLQTAPSSSTIAPSVPAMAIKQEDAGHALPAAHQRPGTSTGYESGNLYHAGTPWHVQTSDVDRPAVRAATHGHSFRDPGQSFRAPAAASTQYPGQSFLVPSSAFNFSLPELVGGTRPGSSKGPSADPAPSLPPLAAVVSSALPSTLSLPPPPYPPPAASLSAPQQPLTLTHVLPLPAPSYALHGRRPSTAARPGTAPASYFYSSPYPPPGSGHGLPALGTPRSDHLSLPSIHALGHGPQLDPLRLPSGGYLDGGDDRDPTSPTGAYGDSPFSFHPPSSAVPSEREPQPPAAAHNPRKRPFAESDDDVPYEQQRDRGGDAGRPSSSGEYDYGSESRPQSRRLSVMELCNDADADGHRAFLPLAGPGSGSSGGPGPGPGTRPQPGAVSRPTTSSGLVAGASQLALVDRPSASPGGSPEPPARFAFSGADTSVLARPPPPAARAASYAAGAYPYAAATAATAAAAVRREGARAAQFGDLSPSAAAGAGVWDRREPTPAGGFRQSPVLSAAGVSSAAYAHTSGWGGGAPGSPGDGWRAGGRIPSHSPASSPGAGSPRAGDAGRGLSAGRRTPGSAGTGGSPRSGGGGAEPRGGNDQMEEDPERKQNSWLAPHDRRHMCAADRLCEAPATTGAHNRRQTGAATLSGVGAGPLPTPSAVSRRARPQLRQTDAVGRRDCSHQRQSPCRDGLMDGRPWLQVFPSFPAFFSASPSERPTQSLSYAPRSPPCMSYNYTLDDDDPRISYASAAWDIQNSSNPDLDAYFDRTYHLARSSGASFNFTFTGSAFSLFGSKGPGHVRHSSSVLPPPALTTDARALRTQADFSVQCDGDVYPNLSAVASETQFQQLLFQCPFANATAHLVQIVAEFPDITHTWFDVDFLTFADGGAKATTTLPVGTAIPPYQTAYVPFLAFFHSGFGFRQLHS